MRSKLMPQSESDTSPVLVKDGYGVVEMVELRFKISQYSTVELTLL